MLLSTSTSTTAAQCVGQTVDLALLNNTDVFLEKLHKFHFKRKSNNKV